MWVVNNINAKVDQCVCTNPSGNHCENPPCKSYIHRYDTFKTAQHLGREKIGVEWIQNHGTGTSGKMMELHHFICGPTTCGPIQSRSVSSGHGSLSTDCRFMTPSLGPTRSTSPTSSSKIPRQSARRAAPRFASIATMTGTTTPRCPKVLSCWRLC